MKLKYQRNLRFRDLEDLAEMSESQQAAEMVSRCYGISVEEARDLEMVEFQQCVREIADRNAMDLDAGSSSDE